MTKLRALLLILPLLAVPAAGRADDAPWDALEIRPEEALRCVAARYRGEPLALRDREDGLIQEIRWRTPAGNVLRLRLTGPGCRFLEVEGVGQTEARILPSPPRETP